MEAYLQVGSIVTAHGIRGAVKVFPTTDDAGRFKKLKKVLLDTGKEKIPMEIQEVRFFKQLVILKFRGSTRSMMWKSIRDVPFWSQEIRQLSSKRTNII